MHPNCRNLPARSSGLWRIKALRAVDTVPGAEYNSSGAAIACIELGVVCTAPGKKENAKGEAAIPVWKNENRVRESPIVVGNHFETGGHPDGMVLLLSDVPSVGLYGQSTNRIGERQPIRGPVLASATVSLTTPETGAVVMHSLFGGWPPAGECSWRSE
jgi:hypothetical protein